MSQFRELILLIMSLHGFNGIQQCISIQISLIPMSIPRGFKRIQIHNFKHHCPHSPPLSISSMLFESLILFYQLDQVLDPWSSNTGLWRGWPSWQCCQHHMSLPQVTFTIMIIKLMIIVMMMNSRALFLMLSIDQLDHSTSDDQKCIHRC